MTLPTRLPRPSKPPLTPGKTLPTMYDLPSDNPEEPGLPDEFHFLQPLLLYLTFQPTTWSPELVYSAADLNLYYDANNPRWYKRPDWFGVVGVPRFYEGQDLRLSYVTWQEKANPFVLVELLSPGTEDEDLGKITKEVKTPSKWDVYEKILRIPYYIVFSRYANEIQAFQLVGNRYQSINLVNGAIPMPALGLSLGLWQGSFREANRLWLRWMTLEGKLIPVPSEAATIAERRASLAEKQAADAQLRAQQLAERLRELGVNPDEIDD